MAQVVLENIYKSFPNAGKAEKVKSPLQPLIASVEETASDLNNVNVLRRINLTVADGEFMVLVGPSGCGKSTLLG